MQAVQRHHGRGRAGGVAFIGLGPRAQGLLWGLGLCVHVDDVLVIGQGRVLVPGERAGL